MERVRIPGLPVEVGRIGLGTWAMGGWMWGGTDEDQAIRTLHAALDRGLNLIDTAPVYGFGRSEEIVGRALASWRGRRDDVVVATKLGLEWPGGKVRRNSTRERVRTEVEDSLRRLRCGRIDLYQVHWPDARVPFEETAAALDDLRRAGKVRALGVSNYAPAEMETFLRRAPISTSQSPYNLFEREIERDVLPFSRERGVAVLAYGALCRGLLSGRMKPDTSFQGDDLRKVDPKFRAPRFAQYLAAVAQLDELARERYGKRVLHLAVRWLLDQPGVGVALWGARRPSQLDPVEACFGWSLDDDARARIDEILSSCITDPVGPEFMAPPPSR